MAVGFFEVLSGLFGWVYTLCWSLSFYPFVAHSSPYWHKATSLVL